MKYFFEARPANGGYEIKLLQHLGRINRLVGKEASAVPLSQWMQQTDNQLPTSTIRLLNFVEQGIANILPDNSGYFVTDDAIGLLGETEAISLGLPPSAPLELCLEINGSFTDKLSFRTTWRHGTRTVSPTIKGSRIDYAGKIYRTPTEIYTLLAALSAYKIAPKNSMDERFIATQKLSENIPEELGNTLKIDGQGIYFRILSASAFTVNITHNENGEVDFNPVLLGPQPWADDDLRSSHFCDEPLLGGDDHVAFIKQFSQGTPRHYYKLPGDGYIFIDPDLRHALEVAHEHKFRSPESRKAFLENPRARIREALSDSVNKGGNETNEATTEESLEHLDRLFVESHQYSARIKDLGIWQPPNLSHIISHQPNEWIPEAYPIELDGESFIIDPGEIRIVIDAVESAIKNGIPYADYIGQKLPASPDTLKDLHRVLNNEPAPPEPPPIIPEPIKSPENIKQRYILQVKENFDKLEFAVAHSRSRQYQSNTEISSSLSATLHPHQEDGLTWLQLCWFHGYRGCLLADDMGLGKTLQSLAFLSWLKKQPSVRGAGKGVLIVAPTGLLENWKEEHKKWLSSPGLGDVLCVYGNIKPLYGADHEHINGERALQLKSYEMPIGFSPPMRLWQTTTSHSPAYTLVAWSGMKYKRSKIRGHAIMPVQKRFMLTSRLV